MIVTTAGRTNEKLKKLASNIAIDLNEEYIPRQKVSIQSIQQLTKEDVLVVGKNRIELYMVSHNEPIFFHPNSSMFRIKRLLQGTYDPFVEACKLDEGMTLLDCTVGLGSDSIIASYKVGHTGSVISIEANQILAYLVQTGLKTWETDIPEMNDAMRRITLLHSNFQDYLKQCPSKSVDVIYFDPMFEEELKHSQGISGIKALAIYDTVTKHDIEEAVRVARKRIVLKDHWKSERFDMLGFKPIRRKTASFHYGVIELENK
ncbi:class I SAM-dependent methyltransferase [Bacillus salitolerans]|uniref:Class I SAM-dependent methyltransferase n=1 Tax=Bacillus salitolerans TaxID=1437434 RepID=A0ABW4LTG0_9BACI